MILDSNLIILAATPAYPGLRRLIGRVNPVVSAISLIEVLGYHKLAPNLKADFEQFFQGARIEPISDAIVAQAISLRQVRKMSLGDAIIAATALEFGHELWTHNTKDFTHISGLIVIDPLAAGDPP